VSGGYFDGLGVRPRIERAIGADDDDAATNPVAMISHAFWSRRFGLDPEVVGRVISVNNVPVTVIGVLPAEYTGVRRPDAAAADIHLPLAHYAPFTSRGAERDRATWSWVQIMGRLRPGVTAEQVRGNLEGPFRAGSRAAMDGYLETLSSDQRSSRLSRSGTAVAQLRVDPASRGIYDPDPDSTQQALILGVVVLLVLLLVCANLATLLLSRAPARQRELAVRLSMGASRGRLVRQLLTESLVLSATGGGLGTLLAFGARGVLPFGRTASFDWRVYAFVSLVSVLAAVLFGVAPALRATGAGLSTRLKASTQGVGGGRTRLARALLVTQVAVSLVLVAGAGLFLRTLGNLRAVDIGFNRANILLFRVDPELNGYDETRQAALFDELTRSIRSVPGVRAVGHSTVAYLTDWGAVGDNIFVTGGNGVVRHQPRVNSVSPGFFETMEIPLRRGRLFDTRDSSDAPPVVVISEAGARELFGSDDPIGRRLGTSRLDPGRAEIVGVVGDVKNSDVRADAPPTVYWSYAQESYGAGHFAVRTVGPPATLASAVRAAVRRVDGSLPLMDVSTQTEQVEGRFEKERLFALAYSLFGGLSVGLTAIGLFGVVSCAVARRTNEIGIRMALGADRTDVRRMILRESLVLVAVGLGFGVGGVLAAGRLVTSLLFGVAPTDGATMLLAVVVMVVVASLAAYLPARRASRVDPMVALRSE
jgi:predicted permease